MFLPGGSLLPWNNAETASKTAAAHREANRAGKVGIDAVILCEGSNPEVFQRDSRIPPGPAHDGGRPVCRTRSTRGLERSKWHRITLSHWASNRLGCSDGQPVRNSISSPRAR